MFAIAFGAMFGLDFGMISYGFRLKGGVKIDVKFRIDFDCDF